MRIRALAACLYAAILSSGATAVSAADLPANGSTPATIRLSHEFESYSYLDYYGDKDWWRVNLTKGNAYVVRGISSRCTTTVSILDYRGKKLASAPCKPSYTAAFEYIPTYTGLHYVEYADNFRYPYYATYYYADVFNDCAGSIKTRCTQAIDTDFSTLLQYKGDSDWRAIQLKGGKIYTATDTEGHTFFLSIRRANGTILAYRSGYYPSFAFYVPSTGKYFVEVKATQDPGFGTSNFHYLVAQGDLTLRFAAQRAKALAAKASRPASAQDGVPQNIEEARANAVTPATPGGGE